MGKNGIYYCGVWWIDAEYDILPSKTTTWQIINNKPDDKNPKLAASQETYDFCHKKAQVFVRPRIMEDTAHHCCNDLAWLFLVSSHP